MYMRKRLRRFLPLLTAVMLLLTGCFTASGQTEQPFFPRGQTITQLHLEQNTLPKMTAAWIPYFTVNTLMESDNDAACRAAVSAYLEQAAQMGITAVFVHVCPFGEAYYPSQYYPPAAEANGRDVMAIMTEECARHGLALHAWINPLRLQRPAQMDTLSDDSRLAAWYRAPQTRAANLTLWEGRYYLNPAARTTAAFLAEAVRELAERYHPAGVHIDDYFYPTDDSAFDREDFAQSGAAELDTWRLQNISDIVKTMYDELHTADPNARFSVSPQGNLPLNRTKLYADVERWCAEPGFCDILIPQLYFGYQNEVCPFTQTAETWLSLPRDDSVSMMIGLAAYKTGAVDLYAGSGQGEWLSDPDVLLREAAQMLRNPLCCGISLYHLDAVFTLGSSGQTALRSLLLPYHA